MSASRPRILVLAASLPTLVCFSSLALAQQPASPQSLAAKSGWSAMIGLGPAMAPEYQGADHLSLQPFLLGEVAKGPYFLRLRGTSLRANVIPSTRLVAGPLLRFDSGRSHDVDNDKVGRLDRIDGALAGGGFIGLRLGQERGGGYPLELSAEVTGSSNGLLAGAGIAWNAIRKDRFAVSLDADLHYANGKYTDTYFGVSERESARSGLRADRPDAGLRDIGIGLTTSYRFTRSWGVVGRLGYSYLLGDAADSPIVDEGSKGQLTGGLALTYRF